MSLHFRGPLNLKQVAVYIPKTHDEAHSSQDMGATNPVNTAGEGGVNRRVHHGQHPQRKSFARQRGEVVKKEEKGELSTVTASAMDDNDATTVTVTATQTITETVMSTQSPSSRGNGVWISTPPTPSTITSIPDVCSMESTPSTSSFTDNTGATTNIPPRNTSTASSPTSSSSADTGDSTTERFVRTGYYNAKQQTLQNLTFLGNYGGQGSGMWTP